MSKIKEFENIPDIDIEGEETLEEAVADCKALFGKYNKELFNGEVSLERCSEARLVLLTLAHRSHHNMEYSTACLKAELLPTSTGPNLDNLAPLVGVERLEAGKATVVIRFTLSAPRTSATGIPEGTQVRTADKRYFKTEKYAEILPGELTVDVVAVADEAGSNSDGIAEGEINVLVDPIPYVSGAKSVSASTGGTDTEGDDSFTRRINYAPSIFSVAGPVDAYEYFASSWRSDVADTKIVCKEGYTIHIYFLMAGGRVPTKEECTGMQEYFDTVKRPMGDLVLCHAPEEIPYDIELTYHIALSNVKNASTIQENVEAAVNSSSGNSKRVAYNGSSAVIWWLRSPLTNSGSGVWVVFTDGSSNFNWYNNSYGVRPAFILPSTLVVSDDGTVSVNTAPTVSTDGAALGQKNAAFAWKYTVRDADGDTLTVTEKLDGKTAKTRTGVASGTALTFEQTASAAGFQKILNGNHTITVEVSDGKETVSTSATFTKAVHAASVTLAEPLAVEGDITVAVLQVTGSIPDDAKFKAEVTNNALDSSPVWQDATTEVKKGVNIVFENKTATNGAAFNFRISVSRGASGTGGYIEAVSGAFQ